MTDKLRKSVRTYRLMLAKMPLNQRDPVYQQTLAYLRALYAEFGQENVQAAMREYQ